MQVFQEIVNGLHPRKKISAGKGDGAGLFKVGTEAPVWQLKSMEGKLVNSADFASKIVIMNFWFKSCLPCVDHHGRSGVIFQIQR